METSSIPSSDDGWTTVNRTKKTAVPTAAGGYIPPHLRKKEADAVETKTVNLTSMDDFPSLGSRAPKPGGSTAWGSKASFTQKIHELIATEQRTETEKMEAEEAAKELEGYAVLSLRFNKERYIAFNEKMAAAERGLERLAAAYDRQMYAYTVRDKEDDVVEDVMEEDSDYDE